MPSLHSERVTEIVDLDGLSWQRAPAVRTSNIGTSVDDGNKFTMRVPYSIPQQTIRTYDCSKETQSLAGEFQRLTRAESSNWDKNNPPPLKHLAVGALVQNFNDRTPLHALPIEDFQRLLETLPVTAPLEVSVPLVPDGVYWKRLANATWPNTNNVVVEHGGSWRRLVLERRLQQELEAAQPLGPLGSVLDETMSLAKLAGPFVRRLRLNQLLQTGSAALGVRPSWLASSGHPTTLTDYPSLPLPLAYTPDLPHRELSLQDSELDVLREDLCNVMSCLVNLEELDVMFGMHDFEKNLSEPPNPVKVACCQALGKTLSTLPAFRRLRVRRSQLHLEKLVGLLEPMHGSSTLSELDLSHCYLRDKGLQVVAAAIQDQPSLRVLRLVNNKFGARGATHLAKSLLQKTCPPLVELDVSLNSIGDVGGHNIVMAVVTRDHRQPLRDPSEDEHVQEMMLAEEKERQKMATTEEQPSHEGITVFRGLVQRTMAGELQSEPAPATSADDYSMLDWEMEPEEQTRRPSALLAIIAEARTQHREEIEAEETRRELEQRRREAAAKAAERWDGCPERLESLGIAACKLGPPGGHAVARLLRINRVLTSLSLSNNHLGQDACSDVVRALQGNPRILQMDLRMCGASWTDQRDLERALGANNAALREPLPLRDMLANREGEYRVRLATTTDVLGRQWERAQGLPRDQRSSIAVPRGTVFSDGAITVSTGSCSGLGSSGGFSGLSNIEKNYSSGTGSDAVSNLTISAGIQMAITKSDRT